MEKIWDNFPQVQLTKLSRVLQIVLTRVYVNRDGRHFKYLSLIKNVFALTALALS